MEIDPTDLQGFLKISGTARKEILDHLKNNYSNYAQGARDIGLKEYHVHNFKKYDKKIHTSVAKKFIEANLLNQGEFKAFYDDKGSSSTPYKGSFPIEYSPKWHFVFCLCIGDGYFRRGRDKQFHWFQKEKGVKKISKVINELGFSYQPSFDSTRHGITIPQLIRKCGEHVLELKDKPNYRMNIIKKTAKLGRNYTLALFLAFFIDEAGMSKAKNNSEITLHQEGNLEILRKVGQLLDDFGVEWSKNKKKEGWVIRISTKGVLKLNKLFKEAKKLGISLLHRENAFKQKLEMAKTNKNNAELRKDTKRVKKKILESSEEIISFKDAKKLFKDKRNAKRRTKQLLRNMKSRNEIKGTKGDKN